MRREFVVIGEPVGKGRPRFAPSTGKAYTPTKTVNYENLVKLEYQMQCNMDPFPEKAMLKMTIKAYFSIPKSASKKTRAAMVSMMQRPVKKPDMDNIIKCVADALNLVAYHDDSQIVSTSIEKYYAEQPRVEVCIEDIK